MADELYRILILIAKPELSQVAEQFLSSRGLLSQYAMKAEGTASSDIMDMLGLGTTDKTVIAALMVQRNATECLRLFRKKLYLGMPNTGVAFTIPVSGGSRRLFSYADENGKEGEDVMAEDRDFSMIVAIVNQGSSEEVMKAARPAGATGGTVVHSRRIESDKAINFWKISIQEEREIVLILARNSRKKEIMDAINKACGMETESNGVVFSLPIADIEGIG